MAGKPRGGICVVFCAMLTCFVFLDVPVSHAAAPTPGAVNSLDNVVGIEDNSTGHTAYDVEIKHCQVSASDPYLYDTIRTHIRNRVKLIDYRLNFPSYDPNPLHVNTTLNYKPTEWARTSSLHGQTLLSLAFNYGVLSLATLTFGVVKINVELLDEPQGCFPDLDENAKIAAVMHLLSRDFRPEDQPVIFAFGERVCHEIIENKEGYAMFRYTCCFRDPHTKEYTCKVVTKNFYLDVITALLSIVRFLVLFFGASLFIPLAQALSRASVPYSVKLKDPLFQKICIMKSGAPINFEYKHKLDFRKSFGLKKLLESAADIPTGQPTLVKIPEYDIWVDYHRLLPENNVPVGLTQLIYRAIFHCKLRNVGPFRECCKANMYSVFKGRESSPWIRFWRSVGRFMVIVCFPFPYYIRLIIYYVWEVKELDHREAAVDRSGLKMPLDDSLLAMRSPTDPLFILIYCTYFFTTFWVFVARKGGDDRFRKILVDSFMDLKGQSWVNILDAIVANFIWPFKRFGLVAFVFAPVYWAIVMPITIAMYTLFYFPIVYLTYRMFYYAYVGIVKMNEKHKAAISRNIYQVHKKSDDWAHEVTVESLIEKRKAQAEKAKAKADEDQLGKNHIFLGTSPSATPSKKLLPNTEPREGGRRRLKFYMQAASLIFSAFLGVLAMYCVVLVLAECIGTAMDILVFTTMGIIINAASMLKYVTYIILIIVYCYTCFNNVPKLYLKLNKAIFSEIKGRCKDLESITSLPSTLQTNSGFKSQEMGEQADHESPDGISRQFPRHWMINDLTLFIDSDDMPRIPKMLFEEVTQIKVAGAPGPVYQSHIEAFKSLMRIVVFLMFVFMVVLSFGAIYRVSSSNQMVATMGGGMIPLFLKSFGKQTGTSIEIGTVSFKSKFDEIVKNFYQVWPIFDMPFELPKDEDLYEEEDSDDEGDKKGDDDRKRDSQGRILKKLSGIDEDNEDIVDIVIYLPVVFEDVNMDDMSDISQFDAPIDADLDADLDSIDLVQDESDDNDNKKTDLKV